MADNAQEGEQHEIKIDLQGLIRLLAKNLYAEADVFVRELIQNAHDSISRRTEVGAGSATPGAIRIQTDARAGTITISDNGNGLTESEIHEYLSTIGRSGTGAFRQDLIKRGRQAEVNLIGQFGIGLLSAFVVASRVEVETLSSAPDSPAWLWVSEGQRDYILRPGGRAVVGTTVTLHISQNYRDMLDPEELRKAITKYADFIPYPIYLNGEDTPANSVDAPWHRTFGDERERLGEYWIFVNRRFPDIPLEVIPVALEAPYKVDGVLYISDRNIPDINTAGLLDIYQSRMFITAANRDMLPSWAKFVRGVIDSPDLTPTASRDAIQLDQAARDIKEALGGVIMRHLKGLAEREPERFGRIMEWHSYHMTGMAVAHDDFFDAVADLVPFETNQGLLNLRDYADTARRLDDRHGQDIFYFSERGSATQFYLLCDAKGLLVINAAYVFEEQFLRKYAKRRPGIRLHHITVTGSDFLFTHLSREEAADFRQLVNDFQAVLTDSRSHARIVRFAPTDLPAVTVLTADSRLRRQLEDTRRSATLPDSVRDLAGRLAEERTPVPTVLHLNADNPTIRQMAALARHPQPDRAAYDAAIGAIYNNALLLAQHQVTPENAKTLFNSFSRVIALLMDPAHRAEAQHEAISHPAPEPDTAAPSRPVTCAILAPDSDDGPFPYRSVLLPAVRAALEGAPYYWRVLPAAHPGTPPADPDTQASADDCDLYLADISDRDPSVLMQLGYLRWARPTCPGIVPARAGTGRPPRDLDGLLFLTYPAATGDGAAAEIAEELRIALRGHDALERLAEKRPHYLSPLVLHQQLDVDAPVAGLLAAAYPTMESFVAADTESVVKRVPGLTRSLARGLKADIADLLQTIRA
ncbi:MAG: heat shock protein Hsp90 family protein [Chloroflexia bacterium]